MDAQSTTSTAVAAAKDTDFLSSTFLLGNVGAPFVIGLAVGYFAKKMLKIALLVGGGALILMFVAEYYGIATVSDASIEQAATAATELASQSGSFLMDRLSTFTTRGASATTGFLIGLKLG